MTGRPAPGSNRAPAALRVEAAAQVGLMLGVGTVAACASWSHVVDLAATHGQPGWLAYADAAVLETLAVSMGLEVRRRRRNAEGVAFAATVLVAAVALQLCAQVAQAPRTFWGWTLAALPAVGFLLLAKVAMSRAPGNPEQLADAMAPSPQPARRPKSSRATTTAPAPTAPARPEPQTAGDSAPSSGPATGSGQAGGTAVQPGPVSDDALVAAGREVAAALGRDGIPLTRAALARGLRDRGIKVGTGRAGELLATLRSERAAAAHAQTTDSPVRHGFAGQTEGPDGGATDQSPVRDRPELVRPAVGARL